MRIALVGPELEENLALRYLDAALVEAGHEVRIFDFHAAEQIPTLAVEIADDAPDVIGLSMVFTARAREFADLARQVRQADSTAHITCGGHFAAFNARQLLEDCPALDSIIHGEGEETIVELVAGLDGSKEVAGLTFRGSDGQITTTPSRANPDDLDLRAPPTRPEVFHEYLGMPIANMLAGRGCYGNCRFCSINAWHRQNPGRRFRQRRVSCVVREMAELYHERGVRIFNFHDDNFFLPSHQGNLDRLTQWKSAMEDAGIGRVGLQIKARPDSIEPDVVSLLREIGLFRVFLGVETNAVAGLETLGRGIRRPQNHEALDILKKSGVHTSFNLLIFDPETTLGDLHDNIDFMRRQAEFPLNFCRVEVYAGTDIHRQLRDESRLQGDYWGHTYQIADARVQLAYEIFREVFTARNFATDGMNHQAMKLDYYYHLLAHFHPRRAGGGLRKRVKRLIGQLNADSAALLEQICRFVDRPTVPVALSAARFTGELCRRRAEFDAQMADRARKLLAAIREEAGEVTPARGALFSAAASVAAALVVTVVGCDALADSPPLADILQPADPPGPNTHMCEMAPFPFEPPKVPLEPIPMPEVRALTPVEAAQVQERIDENYQHPALNFAIQHNLIGKTVTVYLELTDEGKVSRYEVRKPEMLRRPKVIEPPENGDAPPKPADPHQKARAEFQKILRGWTFPTTTKAGSCTVTLEFKPSLVLPPGTHMFEMAPRDMDPPQRR
ncbi:MAG: B12-binding domain-containing radical SAM protein [Planctomycetes bacterium]|nr:B12-binding domain-containing radical SAM protein [Planctomycetota bacterium]